MGSIVRENINNKSDISAEMTAPGEQVMYIFRVKNEGQYDAYLNYYDIEHLLYGITSECTAGENTTASLVEEACEYIGMRLTIGDENGNILNFENQEIKLEKNKEIYLQIEILYNDNTIEYGKEYVYGIQQYNESGIYSSYLESNKIIPKFEDMFLSDADFSLNVKFNPIPTPQNFNTQYGLIITINNYSKVFALYL